MSLILLNFIWVALYFFIFQIEKICLTLQANNHTNLQKTLKQRRIINNTILVLYFIAIIVFDTLEILEYFFHDNHNLKRYRYYKFAAMAILRSSDVYFSYVFCVIISFYYQRAKIRFRLSPEYDETTCLKLPNGTQFKFCLTIVLAILNILQCFFDIAILILEITD